MINERHLADHLDTLATSDPWREAPMFGADLTMTVEEMAVFIRQLFTIFVDEPYGIGDDARRVAASRIAAAVCDAHVLNLHLAYSAVSKERRAAGKVLGS